MEGNELGRQLRRKQFEQMAAKILPPGGWLIVHLTECNLNEVTHGRPKVMVDSQAE